MQVEAPKKLFSARGRAITCRSRVLVTPKPSPKTLNPERKTVNPKPKLRSPKWHLPSAVFFVAFAPSRCGSSQCSRSLSRPRAAPRNYMRSEFKIRVCGSGFHVLDILSYTLQREREREKSFADTSDFHTPPKPQQTMGGPWRQWGFAHPSCDTL